MSKAARFSALSTKCRALENNLINRKDYDKIMSLDNNSDILAYIAENTCFGENLKNMTYGDFERLTIEKVLGLFVFEQFQKLGHFMFDEYKALFKILMMRFEVENVKNILRSVYRYEPEYEVMDKLFFSDYFNDIDYNSLIKSSNMEEVISNLKNTIYYEPLKIYVNESPEQMLFFMELALDKFYFKLLSEQSRKLESIDKKIMSEFVGRNIDIQNIQLLYRILKTFKVSSERRFNYVKSGGHELDLKKLKKLAYINDVDEFISEVKKTSYSFLFEVEEGGDVDTALEIRAERFMYKLYKGKAKKYPFSIASVVEFIHLIEYNMKDLNTIIEAKKYDYNSEDIKELLVIPFTDKKVM